MKIVRSRINRLFRAIVILAVIVIVVGVIANVIIRELNKDLAYKNYVDHVPSGYTGPEFRMLDDYPSVYPEPPSYPWLSVEVNFKKGMVENKYSAEWKEYINYIVRYVTENVKATGSNFEVSSDWYTFPWLSANPHSGREFTHGARYSFPVGLNHFVLKVMDGFIKSGRLPRCIIDSLISKVSIL